MCSSGLVLPWQELRLDFAILGNARTATSPLFATLAAHPRVRPVPGAGTELELPRSELSGTSELWTWGCSAQRFVLRHWAENAGLAPPAAQPAAQPATPQLVQRATQQNALSAAQSTAQPAAKPAPKPGAGVASLAPRRLARSAGWIQFSCVLLNQKSKMRVASKMKKYSWSKK